MADREWVRARSSPDIDRIVASELAFARDNAQRAAQRARHAQQRTEQAEQRQQQLEQAMKGPQTGAASAVSRAQAQEYLDAASAVAQAKAGRQQADKTAHVLAVRAERLQQVQAWFSEDPALERFVETAIQSRVKAAARRQATIWVIVAIVSLVAGWLLNAYSPLSVLNLVPR
jgi:hypothetical protein